MYILPVCPDGLLSFGCKPGWLLCDAKDGRVSSKLMQRISELFNSFTLESRCENPRHRGPNRTLMAQILINSKAN